MAPASRRAPPALAEQGLIDLKPRQAEAMQRQPVAPRLQLGNDDATGRARPVNDTMNRPSG
jgi:hypothetical protein